VRVIVFGVRGKKKKKKEGVRFIVIIFEVI